MISFASSVLQLALALLMSVQANTATISDTMRQQAISIATQAISLATQVLGTNTQNSMTSTQNSLSTNPPVSGATSTGIPISTNSTAVTLPVTVHDLVANPSAYVSKKVQVSGKLINKGNYFLNPAFFITDDTDEFAVNAWVPLEISTTPNGSPNLPVTMNSYLNEYLVLYGTVVFQPATYYQPASYRLQVTNALFMGGV
ncbi:MAG: hypothetical protein A3E02_01495 [Candidatus Zambryskibacteria bacterium RIFCSPHIGHO2_12_FULL_38_34]|uniref:Uncharacterized protein n=1 Tax=Candidatus Zambryskibacteria bacterium RIFCSPLOWO2_12_FULL_39_16 TaxID=1802775 RepID=A0A1G2UTF2_9BACT|nr:MAG: hypothetical protein A3D37_00650 [Candidatus Zambryskibacteria bacterium RIFCSPHIGHO2_02_FULL_38_22]OHA98688.1 MAG: hypothetical protein A3E02_01495 [Candidatus Zambryskibacteria bacterium RIFCSPHIGHO2_12_FULL_38_34]OHB08293.1 MAG: hypothetical protein A3I19_01590 [Candidatus Zambryskibacteria bacterium RIFCSPLOWO2_02_FULL_38_13]OHB12687.1 MAG: hypothetical protein A3G46_00645 [Candidatus Zambryskibacteria bacterium RIFCSPLOWO2_12_FULL_39_16]